MATLVAGCSAGIGGKDAPDAGPTVPTSDTGGGPINTCGADPCDLYRQCGCAPQQACTLDPAAYDSAGTQCREITANGKGLDNCTRPEQCAAGYDCLGDPGQCRRYCRGDGDCGPDAHCLYQITYDDGSGNQADVPGTKACTKACKPDSTTGFGCPSNPQMACRYYLHDPDGTPNSGDDFYYTDCTESGAGGDAADCSANGDADCQAGFGCFTMLYDDGMGGTTQRQECRQICVWTVAGKPGDRTCGAGTCHEDAGKAAVGDIAYGLCF